MGIKVTLYDLFAYTIPGGFYIATFVYLGVVLGLINVDFQTLSNLMATQILALTILAYVVGLVLDPIACLWYYFVFFRKVDNHKKVALDAVNSTSDVKIATDPKNLPILVHFIRIKDSDTAYSIDRFNATSILMRNISFDLLVSSLITLYVVFKTNFNYWSIVLAAMLICLSILAGREAAKFQGWFYSGIYQTIIAYASEASDFVTKKRQSKGKSVNGETDRTSQP